MLRKGSLVAALLFSLPSPLFAVESVTLTLEEAFKTALENNLEIANAALGTSIAEQGERIAAGAALPEVTFDGGYTRFDLPDSSDVSLPGYPSPDAEADLSVTAVVPLYTGGRITSGRHRASRALELAREEERAVRQDILLETAVAFYERAAGEILVKTAVEALSNSRRHLERVTALYEQGQVAKADLFRSELDVAERERDFAAAEANIVRRAEHLSSLLYPDRIVEVQAGWTIPPLEELPPLEEWTALAAKHSPEIRSSSLAVTLAGEDLHAAVRERLPSVGLFGSYGAQDESFTIAGEDRYWNAGVTFTLPLFKGWRSLGAVEQSRLSRGQAANSLLLVRRAVRRAIVEAHADTRLALRQHDAVVKALVAAEENLRVTTLKYEQDLVANTDVIDALLSLSRARFDDILSMKNYHSGRTRLKRLAGTLEEPP